MAFYRPGSHLPMLLVHLPLHPPLKVARAPVLAGVVLLPVIDLLPCKLSLHPLNGRF
jgi:hypothetical protein